MITKFRDLEVTQDTFARIFHDKQDEMFLIDYVRRDSEKLYLISKFYCDDNRTDSEIIELVQSGQK